MANLILVCGPQAVGKMTVAECLRDRLHYNLMTNHDSIEISNKIFGYFTPAQKDFSRAFREKAFENAQKHHLDLIFTYVCAFEMQQEREYLTALEKQFTENGGSFYFVELFADLSIRLERNETPHRLEQKPSKRNTVKSRANLLQDADNHRLNSLPEETWFANHIKIDNSHLSPQTVADMVIEHFALAPRDKEEWEYRCGG